MNLGYSIKSLGIWIPIISSYLICQKNVVEGIPSQIEEKNDVMDALLGSITNNHFQKELLGEQRKLLS